MKDRQEEQKMLEEVAIRGREVRAGFGTRKEAL